MKGKDDCYGGLAHHRQGVVVESEQFHRVQDCVAKTAAEMRLLRNPLWSAANLLPVLFKALMVLVLGFATIIVWPDTSLAIIHRGLFWLFATGIGFRLVLLLVALRSRDAEASDRPTPDIMPTVTILLPLYREAAVLPQLITAINAMDWPKNRLDVKLLLEADDLETRMLAANLSLGAHWETLVLPEVGPRTKPKALNLGLMRAKGEIITIFDAEDQSHPGQIRAAINAFALGGHRLACVQAPLSIHNGKDGWLAAQFAAEYDAHFRVLLPAMQSLGLAFPLGGTSNYFRKSALLELGGWDPHNVTEDADLGLLLGRMGYQSSVIDLPTNEEATRTFAAWTGQRSRWIKGFLQTLLVQMRSLPGMNGPTAIGLFLFLGLSLLSSFMHLPVLLIGFAVLGWQIFGGTQLPLADLVLAGVGMGSALALLYRGAKLAGRTPDWCILLTAPLYWPLQSIAAARALVELFTRPFHWQKTEHGHAFGKVAPDSADKAA